MTITQTSLALLFIATAASNGLTDAANLRQAQRNLAATYRQPSEYLPAMVARVNKERAAAGLPPVCANYKLQSSSQRHSDDMADHDYMAHAGTDGSTMEKRITDSGYAWSSAGENVAAGQVDVDSVMDAWMASPEHRANILGDYNMLGASYAYNGRGTYQHYWTQDFSKSNRESCNNPGTSSSPDTPARNPGASVSPSTPGRAPQSSGGVPNNQNTNKQEQVQSVAESAVQQTEMRVPQAQKANTLSAQELAVDLGVAVSPVPKTDVYVGAAKAPSPAGERSIEEAPVQAEDCNPKF